jgi:hypothetical protein
MTKIGNMFARPRWSMYMSMYLTDSVRRIGAAMPCVFGFCFYCSRALPFASGIIYSAGEFEPGSEALVCLHHRQGFKLVSDCNTNYLSGICLGLTLQIKFKSRFNFLTGSLANTLDERFFPTDGFCSLLNQGIWLWGRRIVCR